MERRFDLLTQQFEKKFWATVWPYVRTDRGNRDFPGKPSAYDRATFALKILPYGVPIGNSVPGLRPGPALPTIIIPHPGALVKCFFKQK